MVIVELAVLYGLPILAVYVIMRAIVSYLAQKQSNI